MNSSAIIELDDGDYLNVFVEAFPDTTNNIYSFVFGNFGTNSNKIYVQEIV